VDFHEGTVRRLLVCLLSILPIGPATAQTSVLVDVPGKTIEALGLEHWTIAMIQDSMDRYAPGDSLQSDACAAVLRYKLHFADAAADIFPSRPGDSTEYILVSVVEPEDSARVRYRPVTVAIDTVNVRPEWREAVDLIRHHVFGFQTGVSFYWASPRRVPDYALRDSAGVEATWSFLDRHRAVGDAAEARRTLRDDPNMLDRMAAAAVLVNFPERDSTWWALTSTLLESDGWAKTTAQQVLTALLPHAHHVDWTPAASTIHALLDGTSLFALTTVLNVLNTTGASPSMAKPFLRGGAHALLAHAGANLPQARLPAIQLLRSLRGKDLGTEAAPWVEWVDSL
jgi:hypothetical protein